MKIGKYIPLGTYNEVKIGYGTVDFKNLKTTGMPMPDGDTAFDEESFSEPSLPGIQVIQMAS
jgi:hypothetical protein